jgi:hypothetical protein
MMRRYSTILDDLRRLRTRPLVAAFLMLWGATSGARAQQNAPQSHRPAAVQVAAATQQQSSALARADAQQKATPQPAQPVSNEQALYLVRAMLLTLNDANRSGNYTVLRDLAAPGFQAKNTAADLAQIFADLRRRNFDLFASALLAPQFTAAPALDGDGKLRLTGFFPTRPLQIRFDLSFQSVDGQWRVFAVSVATPEAPSTQSQVNDAPPRRASEPLYGFRLLSGTVGWRW